MAHAYGRKNCAAPLSSTDLSSLLRRTNANTLTIHDLEARLAKEIRSYLSISVQKDDGEQDLFSPITATVSALVERLLEGNESWGPQRWVDDISTSAPAQVIGPGHIVFEGLLVFGDSGKGTKEWWEPFHGSVRILETLDGTLSYEFMFGDAEWGLGKVKYNEHPRGWNWARPKNGSLFFLSRDVPPRWGSTDSCMPTHPSGFACPPQHATRLRR